MELKICCKCKEEKEVTLFHKNKSSKDGFSFVCKKCRQEYSKSYTLTGKHSKCKRNKNLQGKCLKCKKERLTTSKYCLYHFVYLIVSNWKLPKEEIEPTVQGLIKKLEDSEYCCHYSGLKITPGFSASVDHRVPQAKGGTHELTNLVWCNIQINRMKGDETEKEFINRSANILVELNYLDSKGGL